MILAAALLAFVPFNVQLDYPGDQEGKGVGITDFGCLAVATSPLDASGNTQVLMAAYDEWGSLLWTDSIYWGDCSEALSIQPWSGGLILTGSWTQSSSGMNAVAMAVDGQGAEEWTYLLELSGTERFTSAAQGTDGTIVCAGSTNSEGAGGTDLLMVALDPEGGYLWRKTYGTVGEEAAYHISPCDDGGFFLVGQAMDWGAGLGDFWVLRTDSNGDTLWTGTYGGSEFDYPWRGIQCGDSYYVAGNTLSFGAGSYDWLVLKLDSNGGVVWDAVFGGHGTDSNMALTTRDGLPVVAGMTEVTGTGFLGTVVIFDDQGEPLDQWVYDPGMIRSIELLPEGGFLMSGTGIGNAGDIAVRSVDADGGTPPLGIGDGTEPVTPLRLLPNPASGSVTVLLPVDSGFLRIYDISGRLAAETQADEGRVTLDISRLPEGVYTVTLSGGDASRLTVVR
jgi:hypothetical protein